MNVNNLMNVNNHMEALTDKKISPRVVDFCCGDNHMDALTDNGQIYQWGNRHWLAPYPISLPREFEDGENNLF